MPWVTSTGYTYDPNGNRTAITDANGNITGYTYDARNQLISGHRRRGRHRYLRLRRQRQPHFHDRRQRPYHRPTPTMSWTA